MLLYQKLCGRLENVVETFSLIGHKVVFSHRMIYGHTYKITCENDKD